MKNYILGTLAAFALILAILGISTVTTYDGFAKSEAAIEAQDRNIDVIGGNAYIQSKMSGQISKQYYGTVLEGIKVAQTGRYGENGVDATMLFIHEQNPDISPAVTLQMQRTVESVYTDLSAAQTTKDDMIGVYTHQLNTAWGSTVAHVFGFPRIDLEKAKQVMTTSEMKDARRSGELAVPDLSGN